MKIMPVSPTFLDSRDAIIQADQVLTGGANYNEIWAAFARRGMGFSADDGGNANATTVHAAFDTPPMKVVAQTPSGVVFTPVNSIDLTFTKNINQSSFAIADDLKSFTGPGGVDLLSQITGFSFPTNKTLRITFNPQTTQGLYAMVIGPQILAADGSGPMDQNGDGTPGNPVDDTYTANFRYDAMLIEGDINTSA